jgi:uncharacterized membrane protein YccC
LPGREKVRTAVGFPIAIGLGIVLGVCVVGHERWTLVLFVAVLFVAVFVRRFGVAYFFYGFMLWMGYFFASFMHATWGQVSGLVLAAAIGAGWVLLLSLSVLRVNSARVLSRIRRSFGARSRRIAGTLTELLATPPEETGQRARVRRRLHSQQTQLVEAALMIEAWSAMPGALPPGWTGQALRRRILDVQLALDGIAGAGDELAGADPSVRRVAARVTAFFAADDQPGLLAALSTLSERTGATRGEKRLAAAVTDWLRLVDQVGTPPVVEPTEREELDGGIDGGPGGVAVDAVDAADRTGTDEFVPAVELAMGNLPGSASVGRDVPARGHRLNPLLRLDFTTRQAVQVALAGTLAIVVGRELNATRYYWAVIAAFVAFTGTGNRTETFIKSGYRVLGTLVGLVAGVTLANATAGRTGWILFVIVASMFCGFYLVQVNYAFMIFFVTIMVAQLYSVLHEFSDQLLVLRLEETLVGAAAGIAVALLVAPLSTRDTVQAAQRDLYTDLAVLLGAIAGRAAEDAGGPEVSVTPPLLDPDALMRVVDTQMRDLTLVAQPLTRPLLLGNDPRLVRHQMTLISQAVRSARGLAAADRGPARVERRSDRGRDPIVASACEQLVVALRLMAEAPTALGRLVTHLDPRLRDSLNRSEAILLDACGPDLPDRTRQAITRLHAALRALGLPTDRAYPDPEESHSETADVSRLSPMCEKPTPT